MELWIYDKILRFKGEDPLKRCSHHKYTIAEDMFRQDLANEKTVWTNDFWQDYRYYIQNNHLLVSIFSVSTLHPFSWKERICVLFNETCFAFTIFVLFESVEVIKCYHFGEQIKTIIEALLTSSVGHTLQKFGTCRSYQNREDETRKKCQFLGDIVLAIIAVISFFCAAYSFSIFYENYGTNCQMHLHIWISAQTLSWFIDLFILFAQYINDSRSEKRNIQNSTKSNVYLKINYLDYLKWKNSLITKHKQEIDQNRHIAPSVLLNELEEMEERDQKRRSSLYPMLYTRDSVNSTDSHYVISGDNNISQTNNNVHQRLSDKYPQLKDKQLIIFVD